MPSYFWSLPEAPLDPARRCVQREISSTRLRSSSIAFPAGRRHEISGFAKLRIHAAVGSHPLGIYTKTLQILSAAMWYSGVSNPIQSLSLPHATIMSVLGRALFATLALGVSSFVQAADASTTPPVLSEAAFQTACLAFNPQIHVSNSTLWIREYVPANTTLELADNVASCGRPSQLVSADLCRIVLSIPTSNRSSFNFELWMPRTWSSSGKRLIATGNGGIDGCRFIPSACFRLPLRKLHRVQS